MPKKTKPRTSRNKLSVFETELAKNLYLDDAKKKYWLEEAHKMPSELIEYFLSLLRKENRLAEKNIKKAIDKKPRLIEELANKNKILKEKLHSIMETETGSAAERSLEEKLKHI